MTQEQQLTKNIIEEFTNILKFLATKTPEELSSVEVPEKMNELMNRLSNSLGQLDSLAGQMNSLTEQINMENEHFQEGLAQTGILSREQIKECFSGGDTRSIEDDALKAATAQLKQEIDEIANLMNITLDTPNKSDALATSVKATKDETTDKKSNRRRERALKKRLDLL